MSPHPHAAWGALLAGLLSPMGCTSDSPNEPGGDAAGGAPPIDASGDDTDALDADAEARDDADAADATCAADAGQGGVATEGAGCDAAGATACAGHAQPITLRCAAATCTWERDTVCSGGRVCDSSSGACATPVTECLGRTAGFAYCAGADRHVCGDDLVTTSTETCASAALCAASIGAACAACLPAEHRCSGDTLETCNATLSGYQAIASCETGLCDAAGAHCNACIPGAKDCVGVTPRICDTAGLQWVPQAACSLPNATALCSGGSCLVATCSAGFGNCDASPLNGCEVHLTTDAKNCSACRNVCLARANATATCVASLCSFACNTGYGDCDRLAANGCEANLYKDAANCGACAHACALGQVCASGSCL